MAGYFRRRTQLLLTTLACARRPPGLGQASLPSRITISLGRLGVRVRGLSVSNSGASTITEASTIDDVCKWTGLPVSIGGVGLDQEDIAILRGQKIKGSSLFELKDAELAAIGLSLGARKDLLTAIALLREPKGLPSHRAGACYFLLLAHSLPPPIFAASLQSAVPFLADVPWDYQESPDIINALREGLLLRHSAWATSSGADYRADKRSHPVFTVYAGPGSGKSRLLSELPRLALAAVRDKSDLVRLLDPTLAYVFHVGFENGTAYQISESDGALAVGNRMMWQLMRAGGTAHGFAAFAASHAYSIDHALDKLSELRGKPRFDQPVFLLVDGMHNLCAPAAMPSVFNAAVTAISTIVCSEQFIVGAIAATSGLQLEALFDTSKQARIFLRPPALPHPELVVPDDPSFPALCVLRDDMGGHGRALDVLAKLVLARKSPGQAQTIEALSDAVQSQLRLDFSGWISVQPLEKLLEAIISRRPFKSLGESVVDGITVDRARELGLVQWVGRVSAPGPLVAPVILLLMLKSNLPGTSLLVHLASGYNKLEFGTRSGNWWQDFEKFAAVFRAIKAKAFREAGWVSIAQLHYGARLSLAAQSLLIRSPPSLRDVTVVDASEHYITKSSADIHSVIPWVTPVRRSRYQGAPVDITDGASVVLNGTSAAAGCVS